MNIDLNKFTKEELLSMLNYVLDYAKEQRLEIERLDAKLKLYKDNNEYLNSQLEKRDNIIKEARELVKNECWGDNNLKCIYDLIYYKCDELLEILDVEGK